MKKILILSFISLLISACHPDDSSVDHTSSVSTSTSTSASTSSGVGGSGGEYSDAGIIEDVSVVECNKDSDCSYRDDCYKNICVDNHCQSHPLLDGTHTDHQTPDDCKVVVCLSTLPTVIADNNDHPAPNACRYFTCYEGHLDIHLVNCVK